MMINLLFSDIFMIFVVNIIQCYVMFYESSDSAGSCVSLLVSFPSFLTCIGLQIQTFSILFIYSSYGFDIFFL